MSLRIEVAPPNGRPERVVTMICGDAVYTDRIDVLSGYARQECLKRAAASFGGKMDLKRLEDALVREAMRSVAGEERFTLGSVSMADLDREEYQTTFLVDGLLVDGEPAVIGAVQKTLKTTIAWDLGISIATGKPFLGRFPVLECRRVLYIIGEGGLSFPQEVGRRVAESKGLTLTSVTGMRLARKLPQLDNVAHVDALRRECEACEAGVVFYDPAYLGMGAADTNNLFAVGERLRAASDACQAAGAMLVLIHHTTRRRNREAPDDAPTLQDLAWAGFSEFAAQWLLLGRREPYDESQPGIHKLVLRHGGRHGQSGAHAVDVDEGCLSTGRYWSTAVQPLSDVVAAKRDERAIGREDRRKQQLEADRRAIVDTMVKMAAPDSKTEIRSRSLFGGERFNRSWVTLIDDGTIVTAGSVRKSTNHQTYDAWKLAD